MEYYKQDLSEQSELWESTLGGGVGFLFGGGGFPQVVIYGTSTEIISGVSTVFSEGSQSRKYLQEWAVD